jgi:hypothetical protein
MFLWKEAGCLGKRTFRFNLSRAESLGIHRATARRGLHGLARARLIAIRHQPGRCSEITLLDAPKG